MMTISNTTTRRRRIFGRADVYTAATLICVMGVNYLLMVG
jgi:hypothetical protein